MLELSIKGIKKDNTAVFLNKQIDDAEYETIVGLFDNKKLPSRFQNGDKVNLFFYNSGAINDCEIIKVHFSESKVLYDVLIELTNGGSEGPTHYTRLYNIDSAFVEPAQ